MKQSTKTLLLWGLLICMFIGIWQFLAPPPGHAPAPARGAPPEDGSFVPMAVICGAIVVLVLVFRRFVEAIRKHNAAIHASNQLLVAGRFDEALAALEGVGRSRMEVFRRAYHVQSGAVLMWRGDLPAALAALEPAIAEPAGRLYRGGQRRNALVARSLRAFLRAASGDEAGARADVAALRAEPDAEPVVLARTKLAEARLLDERGDRAALGRLLQEHRGLLSEATSRRERALVRAYEAMLEASAASVYRQKGDRAPANDDAAAVAAWVSRLAPNAAPFVRAAGVAVPAGGAAREPARAETPSPEARRKVEAARPVKVRDPRSVKTFALWVVLVVLFFAVWSTLDGSPGSRLLTTLLVITAGVGLTVFVTRQVRKSRRAAARIARAARAINSGDLARAAAEAAFEPERADHRAQAAHLAAEAALRRGDMTEVLDQCDRAFRALALSQGGKLTPPVAPAAGKDPVWDFPRLLVAQRSLALAALGRSDEAWAEIEWARGLPDGLAVQRVLLVSRLVARDYEGAARVVEAGDPALVLPARDEALAEVTRFVGRPAARTPAEAARLRAELRRDEALRAWIDAMGGGHDGGSDPRPPGLLAAFEQAAAETEARDPRTEDAVKLETAP